jgi:hypothetical protein
MKDKDRYWMVPLDAYATLNQAAVALSRSKQQDAARKFWNICAARRPLSCSTPTASTRLRRTVDMEKR